MRTRALELSRPWAPDTCKRILANSALSGGQRKLLELAVR